MSRKVSDVNIPKLSGSLGRSRRSIRIATRRIVHRRLDQRRATCGLTSSCMPNGASRTACGSAERDDRELVLRLAERRSPSSR